LDLYDLNTQKLYGQIIFEASTKFLKLR